MARIRLGLWCMAVSKFDMKEHGQCRNACGALTLLKKPIPILHMIPTELVEHLSGKETPDGMYGYLAGVCPECGFVLISGPMEAEG